MTTTRRQQQQHQSSNRVQSQRAATRRLRRRTRQDYHESSDCPSSSAPVQQSQEASISSQESSGSEYAVRAILDQRSHSDGEIEFLIDWADHPSGTRYTPSWEPRDNVSAAAEQVWLGRRQLLPELSSALVIDQHPSPRVNPHANPQQSRKRRFVVSSSPSISSTAIQPSPSITAQRREKTIAKSRADRNTEHETNQSHHSNTSVSNPNPNLVYCQIRAGEKRLQPRTTGNSSCITSSIELHRAGAPRSDSESTGVSASIHGQSQAPLGAFAAVARPGTGHVASGSARPSPAHRISQRHGQCLVPASNVDLVSSLLRTPRRFSSTAIVPDSQESRLSLSTCRSGDHKADFRARPYSSPVALNHQIVRDPISSSGHPSLSLSRSRQRWDPVIPETPALDLPAHHYSRSLGSQRSVLAGSPQPVSHSCLSLSQSGYLASSEDEGFGGSQPEESSFVTDSAPKLSIPNAQAFSYSSLESSSISQPSRDIELTEHLRLAPQSTDPELFDHLVIMADSQATNDMDIDEPVGQSQTEAQPNTRSARRNRNGSARLSTQNDESDAPALRKSLRGLRKEAETKRAEIKARSQKVADTIQESSEAKQRTPDSETQSSTGASRGRGRKKKDVQAEPIAQSSETARTNGTSLSNGDAAKAVTPQVSLGPRLPDMQFIVPMPLVSQAGDQYRRTVVYNKVLIENFTATHDPTPDLVSDATQFVQTMRDICMHLDLANEEESLENVHALQQMTWDRSISSKFQLMSILITKLQEQKLRLVIFAAPGKQTDMVEKFLRGHDVNFMRADEPALTVDSSKDDRLLWVHLVNSRNPAAGLEGVKADLLIALDHLMDVNTAVVRSVRQHESRLAPIIFMTVLNSIDHVDRVMASSWKGAARVQTEVACIARLRMEAGKLHDDYQSVADVGDLIAQFVTQGGAESEWPIVPIGPLADNESWDLAMGHTVLRNQENEPARKRSQGSAAEADPRGAKKARNASFASGSNENADLPHAELLHRLSEQAEEHARVQDDLKAQLTDLKLTIKRKDAHVRTLEKDFDKQMNRFEGQTREVEGLRQELEEANERIAQIRDLKTRRDETILTLRDEIGGLKDRLTEASKLLESSTIPEVSELAQLRREKEEAAAALDKAIKQADSAQKLTGYLQEQYRKASDQAVDAIEQNDVLEARVKDLERKASGEAVRLQEASSDTRQKMTMAELERLRVELKNVKAVLAKKEEELKARRSGIGTRAGSVPRSPRVGPASRGTSPIPDRRIENLRNNTFTGRGKAKNPRKTLDAEDAAAAKALAGKKNIPQTPKTSVGRAEDGESVVLGETEDSQMTSQETPNGADKLPEIHPAQPTKSTPDSKSGPPTSRPFPCTFAQYNCNASFTSKNEWKRHISTKHIQIGFWRCDMCNPSPGLDHPVFNDFNRKDLFTQHLRRMHAPAVPSAPATPNPGVPTIREDSSAVSPARGSASNVLSEEQIQEIVKRCFRILRQPPQRSSCLFCMRRFKGLNSWEERLEHVGGHMERDRKNGTNCKDIASWREDDELRHYLVTEGIVEQDQRGNWRIGDGRPRRPTDVQMPSTPAAGTPQGGEQESDGMSRRRRGRPPKRHADYDYPARPPPSLAAPALGQAGYADVRPRLDHSLGTPSQHPTSDLRGPPTPLRMDSSPGTPISGRPSHPRLEPYPHSQHNPAIHPSLQGHTYPLPTAQQSIYPREPSPSQRGLQLPHIMPRSPQHSSAHGLQLSPLGASHNGGPSSPSGYPGQYSQTYPSSSQGVLSHDLHALQQQAIAAAAIGGDASQHGASRASQASAHAGVPHDTVHHLSQQDAALHSHNLHLVRQHLDAQALEQDEHASTGGNSADLSAEEQANRARSFHAVIGERNEQR